MIQIGNNIYKEYNIILLPSDQKASIIGLYVDTNRLVFNNPNNNDISRGVSHNLYIVSEENICINDYCIDGNTLYGPYSKGDIAVDKFKKIVATSDSTLTFFGIPQLPQDFIIDYINSYNQGNIITTVLLEVIKYIGGTVNNGWEEYRLKLNNNNIIIGILEQVPPLIQQLLTKKAEASNKVDLEAYASGLIDMYNALNIPQDDDVKLKQLVELLSKANVRQYTCINDFGYSQLERDIVNLFK